MKALVVKGTRDLQVQDLEIPDIKDDEVLVNVKACGICGSDVPRALSNGAHFYPIVLGHEFSGDIVKIGPKVKNYKIGEKITAGALIPCGKCDSCKSGKPAMCTNYDFIGSRRNGAMAEYIAVKEENLVRLPKEIDYEEGAMIEPLTVAIHGVERINLVPDSTTVVFGAGTIGLLTLQVLKAFGAGKTYVVDVIEEKLELAKKLGAEVVINALKTDPIKFMEKNGKPQYVFETAGSNITQVQCIKCIDKLGKIVYIGTCTNKVEFEPQDFEKILRGELEITGSWMSYSIPFPGREWTTAVNLVRDKKVKLKPLITHRVKLEDGIKPFKIMTDKNENSCKIMFII